MSMAFSAPNKEYPKTYWKSICQVVNVIQAERTHARGKALLAGQLKAAIKTIVTKIGKKAKKAYTNWFASPKEVAFLPVNNTI